MDWGWKPYVPVAERRRKALREIEKRRKKGQAICPVVIEGRVIAQTFWGKAWCENLERYSDFANRMPRGRTYVRNGSVVDLQIASGRIQALVSGSEIYKVEVNVNPVGKACWKSICCDCSGAIDSLVELLQGRLSQGVMERVCRQSAGLFPSPKEISLSCSCPDWAGMCKHVAAVLYGVGARFDQQPELLFRLRNVDEKDLIAKAGKELPFTGAKRGPGASKILDSGDLAGMFGLDMASEAEANPGLVAAAAVKPAKRRQAAAKQSGPPGKPAKRAAKKKNAKSAGINKSKIERSVGKQTKPGIPVRGASRRNVTEP